MATIEQRLKEIAYKKPHPMDRFNGERNIPKDENVIFLICDELKREDFKEPFFNKAQVIDLCDGFKFLTYCGNDQRKNINKNALVVQKKLSKKGLFIYRVYLMDRDGFNLRDMFSYSSCDTVGEHNGYNLSPSHYIKGIKERYNKKELVFSINQIVEELVKCSLEQK